MLTILSAAMLAASGLSASPILIRLAAPPAKQSRVLGGFNTVDVNDGGVQAAAAFAAASVEAELGEVTSAQRQSAAGSNYRISFTTGDGRSYDAVVRSDLSGTLSITSIEETGDTGSNQSEESGEDE